VRSDWTVVIPVKRLDVAKSRLNLPPGKRRAVALAMAMDVAGAARDCPEVKRVLAITSDEQAAEALRGYGVDVADDVHDGGLNAALRHGIAVARAEGAGAVAILSADLAALTPGAVATALRSVPACRSGVVADRAGTGTTVMAMAAESSIEPSYGVGSFGRHVALGAADLTSGAAAALRLDVDSLDDLRDAMVLGVGPHTRAVIAQRGLADGLEVPVG
jgi:2-phospho-L-lactate guanylyltransferase